MRACVRHMAPTHTQLPCARTAVITCEVSKTPRASHPSLAGERPLGKEAGPPGSMQTPPPHGMNTSSGLGLPTHVATFLASTCL